MGKLAVGTHHERVEGVAGIHARGRRARDALAGGHTRGLGFLIAPGRHRGGYLGSHRDELHLARTAQNLRGGVLNKGQVIAFDEKLMNRIRHSQHKLGAIIGHHINPLKPTLKTIGADALPDHLGE